MLTEHENTMTATPTAQPLRDTILDCLATFANQRPGCDPCDYGCGMDGWRNYKRESRSITRDLHDFRILLQAVRWRSSIDADRLQAAFRAFSGRLTCKVDVISTNGVPEPCASCGVKSGQDHKRNCKGGCHVLTSRRRVTLDYCTGQYFSTEYRKAACAVLASALWDWTRDLAMPPAFEVYGNPPGKMWHAWRNGDGKVTPVSAGDWLRRNFRREFGARMQKRWFD